MEMPGNPAALAGMVWFASAVKLTSWPAIAKVDCCAINGAGHGVVGSRRASAPLVLNACLETTLDFGPVVGQKSGIGIARQIAAPGWQGHVRPIVPEPGLQPLMDGLEGGGHVMADRGNR